MTKHGNMLSAAPTGKKASELQNRTLRQCTVRQGRMLQGFTENRLRRRDRSKNGRSTWPCVPSARTLRFVSKLILRKQASESQRGVREHQTRDEAP